MPARCLNGTAVQKIQNWDDQAEYMERCMGEQRAMAAMIKPKVSPTASYQFDPFNEVAGGGYQPGMTYQQTAAGFSSYPDVPRNGGAGSGYKAGMSYQQTGAGYQGIPYNGGAGGGHQRGMSLQATAAPSHAIPRSTAMAKQPTMSMRPTAIVRQPNLSNASAISYNDSAGGVNQNGMSYQRNAVYKAANPSMAMGQQPALPRNQAVPYNGGAVGGNQVGMSQAVAPPLDADFWAAFLALPPDEKEGFAILGYMMTKRHKTEAKDAYHAVLATTTPVQSPDPAVAPPSTPTGRLPMPPSTPSRQLPIVPSTPMAPSKPTQMPMNTMAPATPTQPTTPQSVPNQLSTPSSATAQPSPLQLLTPSPSKRKTDSPASEENGSKKAKTSAAAVVDDFEMPSHLFNMSALMKHMAARNKAWDAAKESDAALDAAGNEESDTDSLFDPAGLDEEPAEEIQSPTAPSPIAAPTPISPERKVDISAPGENASMAVEQSGAAADKKLDIFMNSIFDMDAATFEAALDGVGDGLHMPEMEEDFNDAVNNGLQEVPDWMENMWNTGGYQGQYYCE